MREWDSGWAQAMEKPLANQCPWPSQLSVFVKSMEYQQPIFFSLPRFHSLKLDIRRPRHHHTPQCSPWPPSLSCSPKLWHRYTHVENVWLGVQGSQTWNLPSSLWTVFGGSGHPQCPPCTLPLAGHYTQEAASTPRRAGTMRLGII